MTRDPEITAGEAAYEVGRGKPPVNTRFKPGQSGNPRGRPRGSGDYRQALVAEANQLVVVVENGREVKLPKHVIAARQLTNKAATGDTRAIDLFYKHLGSAQAAGPVAASSLVEQALDLGTEDDEAVLDAFLCRLKTEGVS